MLWSVIVPVKRLPQAKSRLFADGSLVADRSEFALALALDTVTASLRSPHVARVVVVVSDPDAVRRLGATGAVVVPDVPDAGLNPALAYGAARAAELAPDDGIAVVAADMAALRATELGTALTASTAARSFVADADRVGTTMLAARPGTPLDPHYGGRSRIAHLASGAVELDGDWPSLRCDVDTPAALARAVAMGLGPHSSALLRAASAGPALPACDQRR